MFCMNSVLQAGCLLIDCLLIDSEHEPDNPELSLGSQAFN